MTTYEYCIIGFSLSMSLAIMFVGGLYLSALEDDKLTHLLTSRWKSSPRS